MSLQTVYAFNNSNEKVESRGALRTWGAPSRIFYAMQNIHYIYLDVDTVTVFEFGDQYLTPFTVLKDIILI